jgi:hypothetical protein
VSLANIFDDEGDGSEDDGTLYSLADEFLEAARVLHATPPTRVRFSSAAHYLLGHSAELLLKAFLYKHGIPIYQLKKIGHDLEKLVACAREKGLPDKVQINQILDLAKTYKDKRFEYRNRKRRKMPNLDILTEEIEDLQSAVFECIFR